MEGFILTIYSFLQFYYVLSDFLQDITLLNQHYSRRAGVDM